MRKICLLLIASLLLLSACKVELPPTPPPPGGGQGIAGQAAGLAIPPTTLPQWASELKYTDIDPVPVKYADTLRTAIVKPAGVTKDFYIYGIMYVWNKQFRIWEKLPVTSAQSGKIIKDWVKDRATFQLPVTAERFPEGTNYLVVYTCTDTGRRDNNDKKIWDCNSKKWMLGAFMVGERWPNILIEEKIDDNNYLRSQKSVGGDGDIYEAEYQDGVGVKTIAQITLLKDVFAFKKTLAGNFPILPNQWSTRGSVCGFLIAGTNGAKFSWLSNNIWVSIKTLSSTVDDPKITKYGIRYPSNCNLLNELQGMYLGLPGACGNNKVDAANEQCDMNADSACPGGCKPDCTCTFVGSSNFGYCGDNILQKPNSNNEIEECELPEKRDPVTSQLASASPCFTRDSAGKVTGTGNCNDKCKCIAGPLPPPTAHRCGDGRADAGEKCGEPGLPGCAGGQACINCDCVNMPANCGNGNQNAGEQCDPGNPGVACPAGQQCGPTCLCVKPTVCGNGKLEPPEQCEKHSDCPIGINSVGICLACGCAYFPLNWVPAPLLVPTSCGDGVVQKPNFFGVMEECEKDMDCANPPGGTASPTCNKNTCKCNRICGDAKINAPNDEVPPKNEQCDPPGAPQCPPIQLPGGGCAVQICQNDCTCPQGAPCGCGDGFVNAAAGEECEKPGDWCGCAIGAEGVSCLLCSSTCKCGPSAPVSPCKLAGGNDCPPVNGITMGENTGYSGTGTFYSLGTLYPTFDNSNATAVNGAFKGTQCGQVCVSSVIARNAVDIDGADPTKDGVCYYVSAATAMSAIGPVTPETAANPPTTGVVRSYTITGMKSRCFSNNLIMEPIVEGGKCVEAQLTCPQDTICQTTSSGAACIPSGPSSPTVIANIIPGTSGCTTTTILNCYIYFRSGTQQSICSACLAGSCCYAYSCNSGGQLIETRSQSCAGSAIPQCGDGIIQAGEQCELPNTATCNAQCQTIAVQGNYLCSCQLGMGGNAPCFASSCSSASAASTACQSTFGLNCGGGCTLFSTGPFSSTGGASYITGCATASCPPTAPCDQTAGRLCPMGSICNNCQCINMLGILSESDTYPNIDTENVVTGLASRTDIATEKETPRSIQLAVTILAAFGILLIILLNVTHKED